MTKKLEPADRASQILAEALRQAAKCGYQNIKRDDIAAKLGVSPALVNRYFETMAKLKRDVMRAAVRERCLAVIAQGLAMKDRHAQKAAPEVQAEALATLQR